ncbi:chromosome transmission fidelity [Cyanidiococcus yangmingshanensis]|uniref:Chromosome transmission fidelity n=1 Tax=Cyanidiococcus yangmingshanensis TaxID=2690220 RepID=A0A7J7IQJ0_9RHOD|nr:chromosome transmission fidelity [Cyanidiococcus yangmingshanensis]
MSTLTLRFPSKTLRVRRLDGREVQIRFRDTPLSEEASYSYGKQEAVLATALWSKGANVSEDNWRTERLQGPNSGANEASESYLIRENSSSEDCRLWTERYAPLSYTDLLGDDRTYRELLRWLISWSRHRKQHAASGQDRLIIGGGPQKIAAPVTPLAVLSGPTASSKTTSLRVLAALAGLEPWEPRALLQETAQVIERRFAEVIASRSLRTGQPRLVIVDEGELPGDAFGPLKTARTSATERSAHWADALVRAALSTKSAPVVFVLDDMRSRPARVLRTHGAVVFRCRRPPLNQLKRRLERILRSPGVTSVEPAFLEQLIASLNHDVRACLNQLHLMGSSPPPASCWSFIGLRDAPGSLRETCAHIFRADHPIDVGYGSGAKRANGRDSRNAECSAAAACTPLRQEENLHQGLLTLERSVSGEIREHVDMCFENYPIVTPFDPMMRRCSAAVDYHSSIESNLRHELSDSALVEHLGLAILLSYRRHCGQATAPTPSRLKLARLGYANTNSPARDRNEYLLESYKRSLVEMATCPQVRAIHALTLRREGLLVFLPTFMSIVQLTLETALAATSTQRADWLRHVRVQLSAYGLRWQDEPGSSDESESRSSDPSKPVTLPLEPSIDEVTHFRRAYSPLFSRGNLHALSGQMQHLLANGVSGRIRQPLKQNRGLAVAEDKDVAPVLLPMKRSTSTDKNCEQADTTRLLVRYHYREGHTNAVMRPCRIDDFL